MNDAVHPMGAKVPKMQGEGQRSPYLRVVVDAWTDKGISVHERDNGESMLVVDSPRDGLRPWLRRGMELNVVAPTPQADGTVRGSLLILEPSFLADVSSVAACFESYAHSALIHLLNKLKPAPLSDAILLGNFASQLLDEEVHHARRSYGESIGEFFRHNAIDMAACTTLKTSFHEEALRQRANISQLMAPFKDGPEGAMLEPSFFSEMLGLQGRLDFLLPSACVVIEQKSGKGAFPGGSNPEVPLQQEKHRVQLLLYMAALRHDFGFAKKDIHAFLLYSKYARGLLPVEWDEDLLHEAFRVRNELVARDLFYAREGFAPLASLTADSLNLRRQEGRLWTFYLRPAIDALLRPMQDAAPLERAYVLRMLRFVGAEHVLGKMGTGDISHAGFAGKWTFSLQEKRDAGEIMEGLTCLPLAKGCKVERIGFSLPEGSLGETTNFRVGDIVVLYSYPEGEVPDVRHTWVLRASIAELHTEGVVLQLRNPQTDADILQRPSHHRWAMEHDFYESAFTPLYRSIYALLSASPSRRQLLLGQRQPRVASPPSRSPLPSDPFQELVARARRALDFFLIIGPPGTGKTSFGLMGLVRDKLKREPEGSILLLSYTNRAVDEICSKLAAEDIDFIRLGSELTCEPAFRSHLLAARVEKCSKVAEVRALIHGARVVCATTAAAISASALLQMKTFDMAIVDEASQILEPHLMGLLSCRNAEGDAIRRFVLIGDHKQLPAVVQQPASLSQVEEPELRAIGLTDCRQSLFQRLLKLHGSNPDITFMLTRQGRMHPEIADFPSKAFYGGKLQSAGLPHQHLTSSLPRTVFFASPQATEEAHEKVNRTEARIISELAVNVFHSRAATFNAATTLGIIVPYRAQIGAVRNEIALRDIVELKDISIDTVERYQGSQRDVIIYGFTVHHPAQLRFLTENIFEEDGLRIDRKLNVAMTRAREQLLLVGYAPLLSQEPVFRELMAHVGLTQPSWQ